MPHTGLTEFDGMRVVFVMIGFDWVISGIDLPWVIFLQFRWGLRRLMMTLGEIHAV